MLLWVFDSSGQLILKGDTGSDIVDDQVGQMQGAYYTDGLTAGSYGPGDAYIGPVYLPTGSGTYYVAVTNLGATPSAASAPALRYEPVDSINRVAEDNIMEQDASQIGRRLPACSSPAARRQG